MTKRLVVFGDSFAADYRNFIKRAINNFGKMQGIHGRLYECLQKFHGNEVQHYSWTEMLSDRLGLSEVTYYSESGTSTHFTICRIFEYLMKDYRNDDVILVIMTEESRSPIYNEDIPAFQKCAVNLSIFNIDNIKRDRNKYGVDFFNDIYPSIDFHKGFHKLIAADPMESIDTYSLLMTLRSLPNRVVVVPMSDFHLNSPYDSLQFDPNQDKFFIGQSLIKVSLDEIAPLTVQEYFKDSDGIDLRFNHLSYCNHVAISEMIAECIAFKDISRFDVSRCHKNVVNPLQ